jgi:hypothetical protein
MVKTCSECGLEGEFLSDIKNRKLPSSRSRIICYECFNKIETEENNNLRKIRKWKDKISRRFYEGTIKQFCREYRISTSERRTRMYYSKRGNPYRRQYTYYFTYEELVDRVVLYASLYDLIDFAHRKRVDISDIQVEIDKDKIKEEFIEEKDIDDKKVKDIIKDIYDFEPLFNDYFNELPYHIDLARHLMQKYHETKVEVQRGSTRPDIVIDDIGIEIKGPTENIGLQSIADKCFRYPQYFERGLIIVLFDFRVTTNFYDDWEKGLKDKFPNEIVIRK